MLCLIITPYQLCFERSNSGPFSPIESLNLAMDMCFLADFLITFQTGIVVQGGVVESRYVIAKTGVPRRVSRAFDRGHDEPSFPTRSVGQDLPQGLRDHRPAGERALHAHLPAHQAQREPVRGPRELAHAAFEDPQGEPHAQALQARQAHERREPVGRRPEPPAPRRRPPLRAPHHGRAAHGAPRRVHLRAHRRRRRHRGRRLGRPDLGRGLLQRRPRALQKRRRRLLPLGGAAPQRERRAPRRRDGRGAPRGRALGRGLPPRRVLPGPLAALRRRAVRPRRLPRAPRPARTRARAGTGPSRPSRPWATATSSP